MSPAMNSASTPQLRTRNQNPPVVKKALPHSPTQHSDAISPMYQVSLSIILYHYFQADIKINYLGLTFSNNHHG